MRTLHGHTFPFPLLQDSPWVGTWFTSRLGISTLEVNDVPLGLLGRRDFSMFGLQQSFEQSVGLTDWLGVSLLGQGRANAGLNSTTLILRTGEADVRLVLSPVVRVWRNAERGTQVSVHLTGALANVRRLSLLQLLDRLAQVPVATVESLLDGNLRSLLLVPGTERALGGSINAAQALGPLFGLQGGLSASHTWRTDKPFDPVVNARVERSLDSLRFDGDLAFSANFMHWGVPVGVLLEYQTAWQELSGSGVTEQGGWEQSAAVGLHYTGRRNLELGVIASRLFYGRRLTGTNAIGAPAESDPQTGNGLQLNLRYIW
ncbi:MAG: hypothetical protein WBV82_16355 [Myxococcaceae bacterium]